MASSAVPDSPHSPKPTGLVMQIILRRDLQTKLEWPIGPLLVQTAHAATACLHVHASHPDVRRYLEGEDGRGWQVMRKVTLEIPDEEGLRGLARRLDELSPTIPYHMWIEEPEGIPTAIAIVPNKRPKALKKILDETGCVLWK
ncbi:peptidyl-tRNA hydrolase PTRHD1, partial [Tremellales sp. Uapishka_1]